MVKKRLLSILRFQGLRELWLLNIQENWVLPCSLSDHVTQADGFAACCDSMLPGDEGPQAAASCNQVMERFVLRSEAMGACVMSFSALCLWGQLCSYPVSWPSVS